MGYLKKIFSVLILFTIIFALSATPSIHAVEVTATIPVGIGAEAVAYDSGKGEIFVADYYDNTVSVISDTNNTVVATVPVGQNPLEVAYDFGKSEIFVATGSFGSGLGALYVISDTNNSAVATVPIGSNYGDLAYDSGKGEIFFDNGGTVTVISDSNDTVVATLNLDIDSVGAAYDSVKGVIFLSGALSGINGTQATVCIMSDNTNALVSTLTLANGNSYSVTYDSAKSEAFVADPDGQVFVIPDSFLPSVTPSPTASASSSPTVPELSPEALILAMALSGVIAFTFVRIKSKWKASS